MARLLSQTLGWHMSMYVVAGKTAWKLWKTGTCNNSCLLDVRHAAILGPKLEQPHRQASQRSCHPKYPPPHERPHLQLSASSQCNDV